MNLPCVIRYVLQVSKISSEISRIERWTGRFLSWKYITMPKARPARQTTRPAKSRDQPSMPRNETDDRSGRTSSASLAAAGAGMASVTRAAIAASAAASRRRPAVATVGRCAGIRVLTSIDRQTFTLSGATTARNRKGRRTLPYELIRSPLSPTLSPVPGERGQGGEVFTLPPWPPSPPRSAPAAPRGGRRRCRSAATLKIGAPGSLLIATMVDEAFMPTRCWMAPEMPGREVEPRRHGLAARADLAVARQPAVVDHRPAGADLGAERPRQLLDRPHLVGAADAAAHGHDDVGLGQVDLVAADLLDAEDLAVGLDLPQPPARLDPGAAAAGDAIGREGAGLHRDEHRPLALDPHLRDCILPAEDRPGPDEPAILRGPAAKPVTSGRRPAPVACARRGT